jgi:NADP-dependent 3-hydroxy acid dehydrogenase YdfG
VTGASSGIGAATARLLAEAGFHVFCAARRFDRVESLAEEIGGTPVLCDVTDAESVGALAAAVGDTLHVLVNNAGGAFGAAPVAEADSDDWRRMYEVNVIGLMQVTRALLPALISSGDGVIVNVGSTAGRIAYEGGAGYTAAKHGTQVVTETLRLELYDQPVRVGEIAPGMVRTDEFSLVRFDGDREKAEAVYAGVPDPLTAEDVADAITWMATRPSHVNIDELVIRPRRQAAQHKVHREPAPG